jgi:hypothetical protein
MKSSSYDPQLKKVFLEVVENQLRDNKPLETRQTLERLLKEGYNQNDAKILIASAVAAEAYFVMKSGKEFNHERFVRNLNQLAKQSFEGN